MNEHDADHAEGGVDELDHVPRPGGRLTGATIGTVRDRLLKDDLLFRLDDEGITRHFVQPFLPTTELHPERNAWKISLAQIRNVVAALDGCPEDVPGDPAEFPAWVRRELLEFDKLPRDELARLYRAASNDLAAIGHNLNDIRAGIDAIERRSPKTDSDEVEIRFFRYYQQMNQSARDEILDVLANGMKREALRAAYAPLVPGLNIHVPWSFRWNPRTFSPAMFSPIRHCFRELSVGELRELVELHSTDLLKFDVQLDAYLHRTKPADDVRKMLDEHHLLDARRDVLAPALDAYARGELALFTSAVAVQIEGIFEDACHLSGIAHETLRMNTLTPKLELLVGTGDFRIDFAYYAFHFQITRNRIAHGRALGEQTQRTAKLLLLDLRDACRVVRHHPGSPNALVDLLRRVDPLLLTVGEVTEFAVLHADTRGEPPPDFYGLAEVFEAMKLAVEATPVWSFLRSLLLVDRDEIAAGLRFLGGSLMRVRTALRPECARLLAALADRGEGAFERDPFIRAMHAQANSRDSAWEKARLRAVLVALLYEPSRRLLALFAART